MRRNALFLYLGLGVGGLILGYILGETLLSRGSGLYVGPAMAIIGLILAWMLRATRRPPDADLPPPPMPAPPMVRSETPTARPKVNVSSGSSRGRRTGPGKKGKGR